MGRLTGIATKWLMLVTMLCCLAPFAEAQSPWPGQSGNPVGYAVVGPLGTAACGSITSGTSGNPTFISNCKYSSCPSISESHVVFMSVDFDCGTGGLQVSGSDITFYGDRIQSNSVENYNTEVTGTDIYFMYTSVTPRTAYYTTPPGYTTWPSAGAGKNTSSCSSDAYCINGNDGYEYGILLQSNSGPVWIDHADIWGFGNSVDYMTTTAQMYVLESQIHDAADGSPQGYHTDGPGYLNGGVGPSNVLVQGNTIATIGNTNGIAWQQSTGNYSRIDVNQNYLSGFGENTDWCSHGSVHCTNSSFMNNVFGTDVEPYWGPNYGNVVPSSSFMGCNKISVAPGTTWTDSNGWTPSSSDDGKFWIATGLEASTFASLTDYAGNLACAQANPAGLDFKTQGANSSSSGQTVKLTNTGSLPLTITSVALASGSEFAISGNTCGLSLAAGSSCNITVTFTPTSNGPHTDTLQITDSVPGAGSPQLVPLIGLGYGSGSSSQAPAAPSGLSAVVQ